MTKIQETRWFKVIRKNINYICKFYGLEIDVNDEDHNELMELIDNE